MTLESLIAQRNAVDAKIGALKAADKQAAIATVKQLLAAHGITHSEIFGKAKKARGAPSFNKDGTPRRKPDARYRDPVTGKTWTGQGYKPKWMVKDRNEYLIPASEKF